MKCYAETYCKKRKNECNEFCDGYRLLRALYKMSRIPERYCYNIPLVPEGKDLGAFEALNDFMKSVEERVERGEGLYIWSESTGNGSPDMDLGQKMSELYGVPMDMMDFTKVGNRVIKD